MEKREELIEDLMALKDTVEKEEESQTLFGYLHQFFIGSHGLNSYGKPLKGPFNQCQSCLKTINIGQDIRQINW